MNDSVYFGLFMFFLLCAWITSFVLSEVTLVNAGIVTVMIFMAITVLAVHNWKSNKGQRCGF